MAFVASRVMASAAALPDSRSLMVVLAAAFVLAMSCGALAAGLDVRDCGAVGDGRTMDTAALQRAIDDIHAAGGGQVRLPAGTYLSGTLDLKSGVTLHLEPDAVLLGSPYIADYRRGLWPALIKAAGQERIAITGSGTIDGNGKLVVADTLRLYEAGDFRAFYPDIKPGQTIVTWTAANREAVLDPHAMHAEGTLGKHVAPRSREGDALATWRVSEHVRPQLIEFVECRDARVSGVTLKNATNWVQTYRECEDLVLTGLRVESVCHWNNDGMDIDNCSRVLIEDCDINSADDGICLKSGPSRTGRGCQDITIRRCRVRSSASALKFGTASHEYFRRIHVEDLEVYDTFRSAIALETVDGAALEDVTITRVRARNTGNAVFLCIGQRNPNKPPGTVRNIEISDVQVQVPSGKPDAGYEHEGPPVRRKTNLLPSSIIGLADRPVENVLLRDITITYGGGGRRDVAEVPLNQLDSVPQKRDSYPEFSTYGELPAWGFYLRHACGITMRNVRLSLEAPDFRPAVVADTAPRLVIDDLQVGPGGGEPPVVLRHCPDATIDGLPPDVPVAVPQP